MKPTEDKPAPPLTDAEIYARIVDAVLDQRLLPGTKLVEDKLGRSFGVSRTRVRQVLIRLAQEQVVTLAPNRGASVAQPTVEEAREVFEARRLIEPTLIQRYIEQASRADLQALADNIAEEETARRAGDRHHALRLSGRFHLLIAERAGHRTLERMLRELVSRTSLILMTYAPTHPAPLRLASRSRAGGSPVRWVDACGCDDHRALLRALQAGLRKRDAKPAIRLMLAHLEQIESGLCFNVPEPRPTDLAQLLRGGRS